MRVIQLLFGAKRGNRSAGEAEPVKEPGSGWWFTEIKSRICSMHIHTQIARLRVLVCLLGQRGSHGWWDTSFLSGSGLETLEYNFPRAPLAAGISATVLAAKTLHDDRIGRTRVNHLFRLEPELEMLVQRAAMHGKEGSLASLLVKTPPALLGDLELVAGAVIDCLEGPVQVGGPEDAYSEDGLSRLASHYHAGFRLGLRVFPYFAPRGV